MALLDEAETSCPYCGEPITLMIDSSEPEQCYTEDCTVCCQPMVVSVQADADPPWVEARREDD